jgi:hypothetical protein
VPTTAPQQTILGTFRPRGPVAADCHVWRGTASKRREPSTGCRRRVGRRARRHGA